MGQKCCTPAYDECKSIIFIFQIRLSRDVTIYPKQPTHTLMYLLDAGAKVKTQGGQPKLPGAMALPGGKTDDRLSDAMRLDEAAQ